MEQVIGYSIVEVMTFRAFPVYRQHTKMPDDKVLYYINQDGIFMEFRRIAGVFEMMSDVAFNNWVNDADEEFSIRMSETMTQEDQQA